MKCNLPKNFLSAEFSSFGKILLGAKLFSNLNCLSLCALSFQSASNLMNFIVYITAGTVTSTVQKSIPLIFANDLPNKFEKMCFKDIFFK